MRCPTAFLNAVLSIYDQERWAERRPVVERVNSARVCCKCASSGIWERMTMQSRYVLIKH